MIPTYIISVLIGFVIVAACTIAVSRFVDWLLDDGIPAFGRLVVRNRERPHSPKPQSPRKGLSEGDGVTVSHFDTAISSGGARNNG